MSLFDLYNHQKPIWFDKLPFLERFDVRIQLARASQPVSDWLGKHVLLPRHPKVLPFATKKICSFPPIDTMNSKYISRDAYQSQNWKQAPCLQMLLGPLLPHFLRPPPLVHEDHERQAPAAPLNPSKGPAQVTCCAERAERLSTTLH